MSTVQLNPGDVLMLCVTDNGRQLGGKSAHYHFTYDDVLAALNGSSKRKGKSRRSTTPGKKLSRQVALMSNAIVKGVWTTGAPIKRHDVASNLLDSLARASMEDLLGLTQNARKAINRVLESRQLSQGAALELGGYLTPSSIKYDVLASVIPVEDL